MGHGLSGNAEERSGVEVEMFLDVLGSNFFTGVPDSLLKALSNYLMDSYGEDSKYHVIAANEGNALGIASGYHLATGSIPVVYMQNSGEGNAINPLASLLNERLYAIPCILIIGWRGEPGIHDEPQHIYQGEVTCHLLEDIGMAYHIVGKETTIEEVRSVMKRFRRHLAQGKQVAFVIRKGSLIYDGVKTEYKNDHPLMREAAIQEIVKVSGENPIICTTGRASRELFEIREALGQGHAFDFLTVGSMGHASSIALGIALQKPSKTIWCIDGDGAVLMHMGAMAVIGKAAPKNLIHIVINNKAHESVGGMPTAASTTDLSNVAVACGYQHSVKIRDLVALQRELERSCREIGPIFIEILCSIESRDNLGRPVTTPLQNKDDFMRQLSNRFFRESDS